MISFESSALLALGGIPDKTKVGDAGIDSRIHPVSLVVDRKSGKVIIPLSVREIFDEAIARKLA